MRRGSGAGDGSRALIEADLVDCMVTLPRPSWGSALPAPTGAEDGLL
jgi:hypothetical protein